MRKILTTLMLTALVFSMFSVHILNIGDAVGANDSTFMPPSPRDGLSTNITSSAISTGNGTISPSDTGAGTVNLSCTPLSTPIVERDANGRSTVKLEPLWTNHWWSIDYWATQQGGSLPSKMNGTFMGVPNTFSGLASGDTVLYIPLNVAYGTSSTNWVWFQFDVQFESDGTASWYIWDARYPADSDDDFEHQSIGISYTSWHSYNFELTTSGTNTVTFSIRDTTTGSPWNTSTWEWTIPGLTMIYLTNAFSPASAVEGRTTNSELGNVPYFQTYVGYGETTHYHGNSGSIPSGISTAIWTAGSNYYYWTMITQNHYYVSTFDYRTLYGPGSSISNPTNLIGSDPDSNYANIYGANSGDGGSIVSEVDTVAGGNVYIRGYSTSGYYSDLYVYVSYDNQTWTQVGSMLRITQSTPYWISVGTIHLSFRYIAIAGYDSGFSVNLNLDSVKVGNV